MSNEGWTAGGHSVVEVVTDDMPFLVDSVTIELARQQRDVHVVVHPRFDVVRDITGELQSVHPVEDGSTAAEPDELRESWMHVEVDRVTPRRGRRRDRATLQKVLRDVRESVEDWEKMQDRRRWRSSASSTRSRRRSTPTRCAGPGAAQVAGRRPLHLPRLPRVPASTATGQDEYLRAVRGTGLGILRDDQDLSASFAKLPPR